MSQAAPLTTPTPGRRRRRVVAVVLGIVAVVGIVAFAVVHGLSTVVTSTTPAAVPPDAVVAGWLGQVPFVGGLTCVECEYPLSGTEYWITGTVDDVRLDTALAASGVELEPRFHVDLPTSKLREIGVDPTPFLSSPDGMFWYTSAEIAGGFYRLVSAPKTHRVLIFVSRR